MSQSKDFSFSLTITLKIFDFSVQWIFDGPNNSEIDLSSCLGWQTFILPAPAASNFHHPVNHYFNILGAIFVFNYHKVCFINRKMIFPGKKINIAVLTDLFCYSNYPCWKIELRILLSKSQLTLLYFRIILLQNNFLVFSRLTECSQAQNSKRFNQSSHLSNFQAVFREHYWFEFFRQNLYQEFFCGGLVCWNCILCASLMEILAARVCVSLTFPNEFHQRQQGIFVEFWVRYNSEQMYKEGVQLQLELILSDWFQSVNTMLNVLSF